MADLSPLQIASTTKIAGADASGDETSYLAVDENQQALVKDAGAIEALVSIDSKLDGPIPVSQSGTWTIDVSVPAPEGGATEAKQPALGTAGTPSSDVITVQGIASMTALKVDGSATTQPISASSLPLPTNAATAAKQDTGNSSLSSIDGKVATAAKQDTANTSLSSIDGKVATSAKQDTGDTSLNSIDGKLSTTANGLKVDNSAVTQPISASSLPLPTGAATAAKQPALGTAGSPASDVLTVQGAASMTALKVDGSAYTQNTIATNSLINVAFNQIVISAVDASNNPTTVLFKQSGSTVATLTIAYDAKGAIQSVTRS